MLITYPQVIIRIKNEIKTENFIIWHSYSISCIEQQYKSASKLYLSKFHMKN